MNEVSIPESLLETLPPGTLGVDCSDIIFVSCDHWVHWLQPDGNFVKVALSPGFASFLDAKATEVAVNRSRPN